MVESRNLSYPVYANPDWSVFDDYGTGSILFGPRQCWFGVGPDGVVRYVWRHGPGTATVPMPLEALAAFEAALP